MNPPSPKVAIVVLNYNGWKDTVECLESLLRLDYPNYFLIVVDNGSADDSPEKIREWAQGKIQVNSYFFDPSNAKKPLKVIEMTRKESETSPQLMQTPLSSEPCLALIQSELNLGYAGGNNIGIRYGLLLNAKYIWILNNDTVVDAKSLDALAEAGQSNPSSGIIGSTLYYYHRPKVIQTLGGGYINPFYGTSRHVSKQESRPFSYIHGGSLFVRSEAIRQIGLLDERYFMYWEDTDWSYRAKKAGWLLMHAPQSKIWHKDGATSKKSNFIDFYHARSGCLFFRSHYSKWAFVPILSLTLGKIAKRLYRREFSHIWLILKAVKEGLGPELSSAK